MMRLMQRRALVIASQCESLEKLSFVPQLAQELLDTLCDPDIGTCVPALAEGLIVNPTWKQLHEKVPEAFRLAAEAESTLIIE